MTPSRADAETLDAADELASFREQFVFASADVCYVDGNSLGRLPRATARRIQDVVEGEWGQGLIGSWTGWLDVPRRAGDRLAPVIGAREGEVALADSTTVNLYKLAVAALDARPGRRTILTDVGNFPTDRYVFQGLADARGLDVRWLPEDPDVSAVERVLDDDVALVSLSHVAYRSGAVLDLSGITSAAHAAGALTLWDLSHAAGAVPVDLDANGVDLAVGCTYKYLNGGPGSPAFLYVRASLQNELRQPIWGWFGSADRFAMGPDYVPAEGIDRFVSGTTPVLGSIAAEEGIALTAAAGIERIRAKSLHQTALALELFDGWLADVGFSVATPREAGRRGSHVSFRHPEAWRICQALIQEMAVIPDFREPDVVRFGFAPLYTRFVDVWDAVDRLRTVARTRSYERFPHERARVT